MQDKIINIEQEADRKEQLALPNIISNIMNSFANNFVRFQNSKIELYFKAVKSNVND